MSTTDLVLDPPVRAIIETLINAHAPNLLGALESDGTEIVSSSPPRLGACRDRRTDSPDHMSRADTHTVASRGCPHRR